MCEGYKVNSFKVPAKGFHHPGWAIHNLHEFYMLLTESILWSHPFLMGDQPINWQIQGNSYQPFMHSKDNIINASLFCLWDYSKFKSSLFT